MRVDVTASDETVRETVIGVLRQRFGDRLSVSGAIRERNGEDESYDPAVAPDAIFFAESTDEGLR